MLPAQYDMPSTLKSCELMLLGETIQTDMLNQTDYGLDWDYADTLKWLLLCQRYNMKQLGW